MQKYAKAYYGWVCGITCALLCAGSSYAEISSKDYADRIADAISGKADSAALAPVAFSGSYADLTNKPDVPNAGDKADKVADAIAGNLAGLDADGNLTNSGLPAATVANKANKQGAGTADVVAIVDAGGQYVRSGTALSSLAATSSLGTAAAKNVGDFATTAQGAKADTALQPAGGTVTGVLNVPTPTLP